MSEEFLRSSGRPQRTGRPTMSGRHSRPLVVRERPRATTPTQVAGMPGRRPVWPSHNTRAAPSLALAQAQLRHFFRPARRLFRARNESARRNWRAGRLRALCPRRRRILHDHDFLPGSRTPVCWGSPMSAAADVMRSSCARRARGRPSNEPRRANCPAWGLFVFVAPLDRAESFNSSLPVAGGAERSGPKIVGEPHLHTNERARARARARRICMSSRLSRPGTGADSFCAIAPGEPRSVYVI